MIPESELIQDEFIIRRLALPPETRLTRSSLLRWFCLSCGFISPEESRQTAFEVYDALFHSLFVLKATPTTKEIQDLVASKPRAASDSGSQPASAAPEVPSEKLIRYHLNKLISFGLIERKANRYRFAQPPNARAGDFNALFDQVIAQNLSQSLNASKAVFGDLAKLYGQENQ